MDNRTDGRPGGPRAGHGWYAQEARRALGVGGEMLGLRVPVPFLHGAIGLLAAVIALVVGPDRTGAPAAAALDLLLVVCAVAAIVYYDRVLCPPGARPGVEAAILPAAALLGLFLVVAGGVGAALVAVAVTGCALVVGGVPLLDALRAGDHGGAGLRGLRELAGLAIVIPVCAFAAAPSVPVAVRLGVAAAGWAAAAHDLLRSGPGAGAVGATAASLGTGAAVAALVPLAGGGGGQAAGAVALLLAGYGLRGLCAQVAGGARGAVLLEYAAFAIAGLGVLVVAR